MIVVMNPDDTIPTPAPLDFDESLAKALHRALTDDIPTRRPTGDETITVVDAWLDSANPPG